MAKLVKARVLVDIDYAKVKCGQVIQADDKVIKSMKKGGLVDDDLDAVAYAESQGQKAVDMPSTAADAAEAEAAAGAGANTDPAQ